jgi:hypothetical protein
MRDTGRCGESVVASVVRGRLVGTVTGCYGSHWLVGKVSGCYGSHWLLRWFTGCYAKPAVAMERLWLLWKVGGRIFRGLFENNDSYVLVFLYCALIFYTAPYLCNKI